MVEDEKLDKGGWDSDFNYDKINAQIQKTEATVEMAKEILIESDEIMVPLQKVCFKKRVIFCPKLSFKKSKASIRCAIIMLTSEQKN